jgi:hypothetical protein
MRRLSVFILAAFLGLVPCLLPATGYAAPAGTEAAAVNPAKANQHRLLAVGAGAIVGIVVFNMLTYPLGSVPLVAGPLAATPIDIALGSRLLAALVGGATALGAHYLYVAKTSP